MIDYVLFYVLLKNISHVKKLPSLVRAAKFRLMLGAQDL
jgi:hypothetical protein